MQSHKQLLIKYYKDLISSKSQTIDILEPTHNIKVLNFKSK